MRPTPDPPEPTEQASPGPVVHRPPAARTGSAVQGPYAVPMQRVVQFRERLVVGPIVRYLDGDEDVIAWTHANIPGTRAPGVLLVTNHHLYLHVATSAVADISTPLTRLSGFRLNRRNEELVRVHVSGDDGEVEVELSLTNRVRSRSVGRVLSALTYHRVAGPATFNPDMTSPLPPMERTARHHARRIWITVLGVLVLLVSAVFASPFVPGPGALTAVAGIAILAREYEWARDLHVWAARLADRFITWMRGLRQRRRESRAAARTAEASAATRAEAPAATPAEAPAVTPQSTAGRSTQNEVRPGSLS
jgi:uncharacterized protein (TIGR02611 family)